MIEESAPRSCANCGDPTPGDELDAFDWCDRCRREVVHRAGRVGRAIGVVGALLVAAAVFGVLNPHPRFLAAWLLLIAAVYFVVWKLAQRVAFEYIRERGVPAPEE